MRQTPELPRLDERIRRSKRTGKIVLSGVLLVSLVLASVLIQGLVLANAAQRSGLLIRAALGLGFLAFLDIFSVILIWRQHRLLDEARDELVELVAGTDGTHGDAGADEPREGDGR